ncbi:MAG: TIGR03009 domain-containing protein [Pirellulales bacterium]|nr:TIGR03009 domain-containing protein [Pirellulales bacterium]
MNRSSLSTIIVFFVGILFVSAAMAQQAGSNESRPLSQPRTPAVRQPAQSQPAAAGANQPRPIQPPFVLTPEQQKYIDQLLAAWEAKNKMIDKFSSSVRRYKYDTVFGPKDGKPMQVDEGTIKYERPDKGLFQVKGDRPEQWICDGKSVYQYEYKERTLKEYELPPDLQGKAIEDGPLPFIFTASAEKMKRRFWLRAVAPPPGVKDQYWIEAFPRHQHDAASFKQVLIILGGKDLLPVGIQMFATSYDGQTNFNRDSFEFYDIVINDPLGFLKGDPFAARTPFGWKKVVEKERGQPARMSSQPEADKRR